MEFVTDGFVEIVQGLHHMVMVLEMFTKIVTQKLRAKADADKGGIFMGFEDTLGKIGRAVVNGTARYLENQSKYCARNKNFTDEQRAAYAEFSNNMHEFRDRFNSSDSDDYDDDDYDY